MERSKTEHVPKQRGNSFDALIGEAFERSETVGGNGFIALALYPPIRIKI